MVSNAAINKEVVRLSAGLDKHYCSHVVPELDGVSMSVVVGKIDLKLVAHEQSLHVKCNGWVVRVDVRDSKQSVYAVRVPIRRQRIPCGGRRSVGILYYCKACRDAGSA